MRHVAVMLFSCILIQAQIVDRLAVAVGSTVITELQIDEDLRVAALLNNQPISRDLESKRTAADRLVDQLLIDHEIGLSRYPPPSDQDVETLYSRIRETLGGPKDLNQLLRKYEVSEETLRAHLKAQLATLRFIDVRFTPDISISDSEIDSAYRQQSLQNRAANPNVQPSRLDENERKKLTTILLGQRTDSALNSWLAESRKQVNIVYLDSALR